MTEEITNTETGSLPVTPEEAHSLAQMMANSYRTSLDYYKRELHLAPQAAHDRAEEMRSTDYPEQRLQLYEQTPLRNLDWDDFERIERINPDLVMDYWQRIKAAAQQGLSTGDRGSAAVLDFAETPWLRAEYLALRQELARDWQPRSGIEQMLIDQMAQTYTLYLRWLAVANGRAMKEYRALSRNDAKYEPPRVSEQACEEFAVGMVDRFQRMFLRTLRALRDMRRYTPVIVQNAGQVNVATNGGQQVNVSQP